jgi:hypothetical protein
MLAQLVGARRPTVSTALGELARDREVLRQPDGSWLLTGEPVGEPVPANARLVPPRRRMLAALPDPDAVLDPAPAPADGRRPPARDELLERLRRVREDYERMHEQLLGGYETTAELWRRSTELREGRARPLPAKPGARGAA